MAILRRSQNSVNNDEGPNGGEIEVNSNRSLRLSSTTLAGVTFIEDDDGTNLAIIYDDDVLDQLEEGFFGEDIRRSLGHAAFHVNAEVETVASTCTDLSGEGDEEGTTPAAGRESANYNPVNNPRSENNETFAIDPETGMSLPVATPMRINNEDGGDDGWCKTIRGIFDMSFGLASLLCFVSVIPTVLIVLFIILGA